MSLGKSKHFLQQIKTFPLVYGAGRRKTPCLVVFYFFTNMHFCGEKEESRLFSCLAGNRHLSWKVGEKLSCQISVAYAPLGKATAQGTHPTLLWSQLKILLSHSDHRLPLMVHKQSPREALKSPLDVTTRCAEDASAKCSGCQRESMKTDPMQNNSYFSPVFPPSISTCLLTF